MPSTSNSEGRRPSFWRAFLPFWFGLVWSLISIAATFHLRERALTRIAMQVTIDGKEPDREIRVTVDEQPQSLGSAVPMGSARIRIFAADCEPQTQERFIWYGVTDLGAVDLVRSRGGIEANVLPAPDSFELTGNGIRLTNSTGSFPGVIVGRYRLTCRFAHLEESVDATVTRNQTTPVKWAAKVGRLELSAEPAEGEFDLVPEGAKDSGYRGTFPTRFRRIASGDYRLTAKRPGYERELKVQVRPNETNQLVVKFAYGSAQISSTPEGATVLLAGVKRGKTPLPLSDIVPGRHRIELRLDGFVPHVEELTVTAESPAALSVTLASAGYRTAMEAAKKHLESRHFWEASVQLSGALSAIPGDPEASALLAKVRPSAVRERAKQLANMSDYQGAIQVLDSYLTDSPGDKGASDLLEQMNTARQASEAKRIESKVQELMVDARTTADRRQFDQALGLLEQAQKLAPENMRINQLQASISTARERYLADEQSRRREKDIADRNHYRTAWGQAQQAEPNANLFPSKHWETAKTLAEVRSAIEQIGTMFTVFKVSEMSSDADFYFTAKLGGLLPPIQDGYYFKIGVVRIGSEKTQIAAKVFAYNPVEGKAVLETNKDVLQDRLERLRSRLSEQLGAPVF